MTSEIDVPPSGAEGVIIAQGCNVGGWTLYARGGKLKYCYNLLGIQYFYAESEAAIPAGQHQVRMEFAYAGGGLGKGGTATLYIDGKKVGLLILGGLASIFIVTQFVLARMILSNRGSVALRRSQEHTGCVTVAVVLVYVAFSVETIAWLRARRQP